MYHNDFISLFLTSYQIRYTKKNSDRKRERGHIYLAKLKTKRFYFFIYSVKEKNLYKDFHLFSPMLNIKILYPKKEEYQIDFILSKLEL